MRRTYASRIGLVQTSLPGSGGNNQPAPVAGKLFDRQAA
jgi:hypothetical protein